VSVNRKWLGRHQQLSDACLRGGSCERPVYRTEPAVLPEGEVKMSDVAETDERFRIRPYEVEVEKVRDAICTGTTTGGHDASNFRIGECIVEVGEAVLVTTGAEPVPVQRVRSDIDSKAPTFEHFDRLAQPSDLRPAGRGYQTNDITALHDRRNQHLPHSEHGQKKSEVACASAPSMRMVSNRNDGLPTNTDCPIRVRDETAVLPPRFPVGISVFAIVTAKFAEVLVRMNREEGTKSDS